MSSGEAAQLPLRPTGGEADPEQEPQPSFLEGVVRMFLVFAMLQFASQSFFGVRPPHVGGQAQGGRQGGTPDSGGGGGSGIKPLGADGGSASSVADRFAQGRAPTATGKTACLWNPGSEMDLSVYFTDAEEAPTLPIRNKGKKLLGEWHESGLTLRGAKDDKDASGSGNDRATNLTVALTDAIRNNETHLYAHVRLTRRRESSDGAGGEGAAAAREEDVLAKTIQLTRHTLRKRERDEKSLLSGGDDEETSGDSSLEDAEAAEADEVDPDDKSPLTAAGRNTTHDQILLYIKPSLTLQLVDTFSVPMFPDRRSVPPQFSDHMDWLSNTSSLYYPILYSSEFWITKASCRAVNGTLSANANATIEVRIEDVAMWKWQLMSQMESTWRTQAEVLGEDDGASDMLRSMLLETNPYLLAVTAVVSVLHSIFDFLAFKNDITFFKGKKSMEGLSVRSMVVNAIFQVVIWLYLADNETSKMILISNGIGLLIEVWKISRAIKISFAGGKIQWKATETYAKSTTREYDEIATNHLMYIAMPLVSGYGMYSLMHQKHKGWYSWVLNALVGYIYMFGFVMMTPQLFINYKLKSVAHLNWRTMTFKSINTFIDDLFAFVIKMPIMHRLACLRDDVVFFVFLYQRWIYRTDYTRVNEYGQGGSGQESELEGAERKAVETDDSASDRAGGIAVANTPVEKSASTDNLDGAVRQRRGAREKRS